VPAITAPKGRSVRLAPLLEDSKNRIPGSDDMRQITKKHEQGLDLTGLLFTVALLSLLSPTANAARAVSAAVSGCHG
jgi:hypothetical protein